MLDLNVAVAFAVPDNATHPDAHLFNNYSLDDPPLYDPFVDFDPDWLRQQEVDELGRITDEVEQSTSLGKVASQPDSGKWPAPSDIPFLDDFFHTLPESVHSEQAVPQNHDWFIATDMHSLSQITGEPFATPSLLPSDLGLDSNPVELLMNSIVSRATSSPASTFSPSAGETQPGKRKISEDGIEDEHESGSTSLLSDGIEVCLWRNCGVRFKNRLELRYCPTLNLNMQDLDQHLIQETRSISQCPCARLRMAQLQQTR